MAIFKRKNPEQQVEELIRSLNIQPGVEMFSAIEPPPIRIVPATNPFSPEGTINPAQLFAAAQKQVLLKTVGDSALRDLVLRTELIEQLMDSAQKGIGLAAQLLDSPNLDNKSLYELLASMMQIAAVTRVFEVREFGNTPGVCELHYYHAMVGQANQFAIDNFGFASLAMFAAESTYYLGRTSEDFNLVIAPIAVANRSALLRK